MFRVIRCIAVAVVLVVLLLAGPNTYFKFGPIELGTERPSTAVAVTKCQPIQHLAKVC